MAVDFPSGPANNATHTSGGKTWTFDGTIWQPPAPSGGGGGGPTITDFEHALPSYSVTKEISLPSKFGFISGSVGSVSNSATFALQAKYLNTWHDIITGSGTSGFFISASIYRFGVNMRIAGVSGPGGGASGATAFRWQRGGGSAPTVLRVSGGNDVLNFLDISMVKF